MALYLPGGGHSEDTNLDGDQDKGTTLLFIMGLTRKLEIGKMALQQKRMTSVIEPALRGLEDFTANLLLSAVRYVRLDLWSSLCFLTGEKMRNSRGKIN